MIVSAMDCEPELVVSLADTAWASFVPRPDDLEEFDEQTSYVNARDLVSFALGGNASGKTAASAKKCSDFILNTPPPRPYTPFWIIGATYKQVSGVCWAEKLHGEQFIPNCEVDWSKIQWYEKKMRWPSAVPLKPWPNGNNWCLEFMSYEQGREAMQARSIGGFWFSEQFPWNLFIEVLRGCRDYMYPGGQFCEFTPIDPELCVSVEAVMDDPPPGWKFYRLNTQKNRENLAKDWFDQFFAAVPDEMLATRMTGALATFEGVIFPSFNPQVHIIDNDDCVYLSGMNHHRGTDWGASAEHPFTTVWGCYDGVGDWWIYDEYWNTSQDRITQDHAIEVCARSVAWGWPWPENFDEPNDPRYQEHWEKLQPYIKSVRNLVDEIRPRGPIRISGNHYGEGYADPSRPGEINAFNYYGVITSGAYNDIYKGIDIIRTKLKTNPITHRPHLYIHQRCKHLIEEMRKYRWTKKRKQIGGTSAAPKPVPLKLNDDTVDAERYLIATTEFRRGLAPASTSTNPAGLHRQDMQFNRPGNGRQLMSPTTAATTGFFRR